MVGQRRSNETMNPKLSPIVRIQESAEDIPSGDYINDESQCLIASADKKNNRACLKFTSRLALYDFARELLYEAIYSNCNQIEYLPTFYDGRLQLINGVRMPLDSTRLFVFIDE